MMPILPFIEDSEENIAQIVTSAHACGVTCIVPWFGMSLRTGQREHFYQELDRLFPGLREQYEHEYGFQYSCACPNAQHLRRVFDDVRRRYGIATHLDHYRPDNRAIQLSLC
jgi:DNA repair photolyase